MTTDSKSLLTEVKGQPLLLILVYYEYFNSQMKDEITHIPDKEQTMK